MKRWFTVVALATLVVIALASCGAPPPPSPTQTTQASPSPSPTPSLSPSPTQSPSPTPTPTPSPTPTPKPTPSPTATPPSPGQLPNVLPYPNALETVKVTTEGSGPEGQNGTVVYSSLETTDTYEAVKAYYEKQVPPGWKNVSSFENTDENGDRTFTISTQNPEGTAWFIFLIMEQKADGKVIISHNVGTEGSASAQPADTGPLKPYPNATVVSSSSWTGMGGNGKEGKWTAVILSTTDSYEQVKAYYESNKPSGFDTSYSGENTDENGARTYSAWFASADQVQFYMVGVSENKTENKIEISQTFGSGT